MQPNGRASALSTHAEERKYYKTAQGKLIKERHVQGTVVEVLHTQRFAREKQDKRIREMNQCIPAPQKQQLI